mgnify:CR=1 FL=1
MGMKKVILLKVIACIASAGLLLGLVDVLFHICMQRKLNLIKTYVL